MINYIEVKVSGKNIKRFISKLFKLNINIYDIKTFRNCCSFKVSYEDYLKVKKIKTIYNIEIVNIRGIKRIKILINKYKIFFIFFILGMIIIYFLSHIIFFIEIDYSKKEVVENINKELVKNNLTLFSFSKSNKELDVIVSIIKNNLNDSIEWLEIKQSGVKYIVKLIERIPNNEKYDSKTSSIVAKKDGMIMDMYVEGGQILKNKGDYVKKGEVIVSGVIKRGENVVDIVRSNAKVYAEVWMKTKLNQSLEYEESVVMGSRECIYLNVLGKDILLFSKNVDKNNKDKILFNSNFFKLKKVYKSKMKVITKKYREDELIKKLENDAYKKIESMLSDDKEKILLQKTLKKDNNNGKISIEVFFKVYQNIALEQDIGMDELEQTKE